MGRYGTLTATERSWLEEQRTRYATELYEFIYYRLLGEGLALEQAVQDAQQRVLRVMEDLAEYVLRHQKSWKKLYDSPEETKAWLWDQANWLTEEEKAWVAQQQETYGKRLLTHVYHKLVDELGSRFRAESLAEDVVSITMRNLMRHIMGHPEHIEAFNADPDALEKWLWVTASNKGGYSTPYRAKKHYSGGMMRKLRGDAAHTTPLISEAELEAGIRGVTEDLLPGAPNATLEMEMAAFEGDDFTEREKYALAWLKKQEPLIQWLYYMYYLYGYTYQELGKMSGQKPDTLRRRLSRHIDTLKREVDRQYPPTDPDPPKQKGRPRER